MNSELPVQRYGQKNSNTVFCPYDLETTLYLDIKWKGNDKSRNECVFPHFINKKDAGK